MVILFLTSMVESFPVIGVLVPGQQIMLVVGGFYAQKFLVLAIVASSLGAALGNWAGYVFGARYGRQFLDNYGEAFAL